jgi:hypothetical protein
MFTGISDRWKMILQISLVLLFGAGVIGVIFALEKNRSTAGAQRVEFRVDASGGYAIITLDAGSASISKPTTVSVPWTKSIRVASGTEVYLTASNPTQSGKLTCTIMLGQSLWKTDTTAAPKDGVACAGIVP